ncbi:aminotransferase class V-fold PLP-dependent enzyme [Paracoccus fistulariae]|uniref:Aminotransferase class V-fold PLP-dependent enzyme n=1 Tax=Paracoccus fistulariae TaxID=658446 RepID=A0ABY7SFY1_9RHOB|nr:aminotransferase class V-fold PLP-dependent enzyme [Paracoccus fistulariae]MDB6181784.1 aminotransferase class V-fold PLP-dependent enzyme [Paracoccus fistulariae]WCR05923.1 aminotransferase class V-fold PLP-dependent enzyme [Paracoccus fistulariae]
MKIDKIVSDSPVSAKYAYFDTGAAAPPPTPVIDRVKAYLDETAELGTYLPSLRKRVYEDLETTRAKTAAFIGAKPEEIAFTKNGTEAICLVAQGIDWAEGDEIIVPETEMLSNLSVWLQLEQQRGIRVVRAKASLEGLLDAAAIAEHVTDRTRLISFVALSNVTGAVQPVAEICAMAQQRGVMTHVDAAQAIGVLDVDIHDWGCDFLSTCGRKGLRAIEGSGFLYIAEPRIAELSSCMIGWWNSSVDGEGALVLPQTAKRFEAGCPNVPAIYSLDAALDYASDLGQGAIEARCREITDYALQGLARIPGFELYGPADAAHRIGIIPFNIKGLDPRSLVLELEMRGIIIEAGHFMASSILEGYNIDCMARASIHYFNTEAEIDRLVSNILDIKESK